MNIVLFVCLMSSEHVISKPPYPLEPFLTAGDVTWKTDTTAQVQGMENYHENSGTKEFIDVAGMPLPRPPPSHSWNGVHIPILFPSVLLFPVHYHPFVEKGNGSGYPGELLLRRVEARRREGRSLEPLYVFYFSLFITKHFLFIHIQVKFRVVGKEVGRGRKNKLMKVEEGRVREERGRVVVPRGGNSN